jgi:hypothetical protein
VSINHKILPTLVSPVISPCCALTTSALRRKLANSSFKIFTGSHLQSTPTPIITPRSVWQACGITVRPASVVPSLALITPYSETGAVPLTRLPGYLTSLSNLLTRRILPPTLDNIYRSRVQDCHHPHFERLSPPPSQRGKWSTVVPHRTPSARLDRIKAPILSKSVRSRGVPHFFFNLSYSPPLMPGVSS